MKNESFHTNAARAVVTLALALGLTACESFEERAAVHGSTAVEPGRLFLDVHHLDPAEVSVDGVAGAHAKDMAHQDAFGVRYERYWVDEDAGRIYCLVRSPSAHAAEEVHRLAHGLVADEIHEVQEGILPAAPSGHRLFLDTHEAGPGVSAADVADAHREDLEVQARHGVRFLEYWVDESTGRIHCLAEAPTAEHVTEAHREAHGLLPTRVDEVVEGR